MSDSDFHVVELQLNQEEYTRAEFVANLGAAFGIFGVESAEELVKKFPRAAALLEPRHVLRRDVADRVQPRARKLCLGLAPHAR